MDDSKNRLLYLLQGYKTNMLSRSEHRELFDLLGDPRFAQQIRAYLDARLKFQTSDENLPAQGVDWEYMFRNIVAREVPQKPSARRMYLLHAAWFRYAAILLLILGAGTYFLFINENKKELTVLHAVGSTPLQKDVLPGGNKAILTLEDGTDIILDSTLNGHVAQQGEVRIIKQLAGRLEYQVSDKSRNSSGPATYNTMRTPNGGQYQLRLSDGTDVWLNAASSITYPTAFTGKERIVKITGEVYFEVKPISSEGEQGKIPFIVDIPPSGGKGECRIEVLGTHFNVNAYPDEPSIATTLLEGSVRINFRNGLKVLKPGQQAQVNSTENIRVKNNVNLAQTMAWKDGIFSFSKATLEMTMRQISRWYDVDIVYEKGIPEVELRGEMGRDLTLQQVLRGLDGLGVNFSLEEENRLIVTPDHPKGK